ncbi:hypothetical protein Afil01_23820 [Actinorhabdospora filicis]|uniref:Uncharacterized protein n=1 Tax=Actinorhabdospora filicis TaxID=1785913 RepID=A0A9W6SI77_9ACTN|nr:hypothetical protein Afil01_23820 [Actinorhabdospora filicis]
MGSRHLRLAAPLRAPPAREPHAAPAFFAPTPFRWGPRARPAGANVTPPHAYSTKQPTARPVDNAPNVDDSQSTRNNRPANAHPGHTATVRPARSLHGRDVHGGLKWAPLEQRPMRRLSEQNRAAVTPASGPAFAPTSFLVGAQSPPRWGERNPTPRVLHQTAHRAACG